MLREWKSLQYYYYSPLNGGEGPPQRSKEKVYRTYQKHVPDWCAVEFPISNSAAKKNFKWCGMGGKRIYWYNDLERANNARIWARALYNARPTAGRTGWAHLAKAIGLLPKQTLKQKNRADDHKEWAKSAAEIAYDQAHMAKRFLGKTEEQIEKMLLHDGWRCMRPTPGDLVYRHCVQGKLPKDPVVKQKLFDIAGYPWE
jgi:hypothetical protein